MLRHGTLSSTRPKASSRTADLIERHIRPSVPSCGTRSLPTRSSPRCVPGATPRSRRAPWRPKGAGSPGWDRRPSFLASRGSWRARCTTCAGVGSRRGWSTAIPISSMPATARASSSCGSRARRTRRLRVREAASSRPWRRRAMPPKRRSAKAASRRLGRLLAEGVTTIEIKSGYGLRTDAELKQLRVARRIGESAPVTVRTTFLGAHAVPPEFKGRQEEYVALVCGEMLPAVAEAGLADAVDAFCEGIAFSPAQTARVFEACAVARPAGEAARRPAVRSRAGLRSPRRSARCRRITSSIPARRGVRAMADAGTVAVLLPGAFYFLREKKVPPMRSAPRSRRADRGVALTATRLIPAQLDSAGDEYRLHVVPPDARRGARGGDAATRHARSGCSR